MPAPVDTPPADTTAEALIKATLEVVAQHGLKGATTRLIAQRAGVNEVTLFRKYGNKVGLIKAAVLARAGELQQQGIHYTGNLEADLIHLTREYLRALKSFGSFLRVVVTEFPRHPELAEVLQGGPRQLFVGIAALLTRYQQEGQLRPEPVTTLVPAFIGPLILPHLIPDIAPLLMQTELPLVDPETHVRHFLHGRGLEDNV